MSNLSYQIVYCTGEDDGYEVKELLHPSATSKGYATPRYCEYPQYIILQFLGGKARITQIQFLSHENKIAQRIVFYFALEDTLEACKFVRIGHVRLNSNEGSEYKSRELKTIHIDNEAVFLKIEITGCYNNVYNIYRQVGILGINIFGEPTAEAEYAETALQSDECFVHNSVASLPSTRNTLSTSVSNMSVKKYSPKTIPNYPIVDVKSKAMPTPLDDLSFDMRFDPATAQKIREVHLAKERAVEMEDYDQAKKLKEYEDHLKSIGIQMARLDIQKKTAISNEDYDLAKKIKMEMETLMQSSDGFNNPIRMGMPQKEPLMAVPNVNRDDIGPPVPVIRENSRPWPQEIKGMPQQNNMTGSTASLKTSASMRSMNNGNDGLSDSLSNSEFPAQRGGTPMTSNTSFTAPSPLQESLPRRNDIAETGISSSGYNGAEGMENLPIPDELPDSLKYESTEMISIIGEYLVRCFYNAAAILRAAAIKKIDTDLDRIPGDRRSIFNVGCTMVDGGMADRNNDIFIASAKLLNHLLDYAVGVPSEDIANRTEKVVIALMNKIGEGKPKAKDSPAECLRDLARHRFVGPATVAHYLLAVPKRTLNAKALLGRLIVIQGLVNEFGTKNEYGLGPEDIIKFVHETGGFSHIQPDVREAAKEVAISIFKKIGYSIETILQPLLKEKQVNEYHAAFEKASGTPSKASATVSEDVRQSKNNPPAQHNRGIDENNMEEEEETPPDECQFCHRKDSSFVNESNADRHYWSDCPMLIPCRSCEQIIEVADLNQHLIEECEMRDKHKMCPRCGEAINIEFFAAHAGRADCVPRKDPSQASRCPLCHEDIPARKGAWVKHLVVDKCPMNPRTNR